uniref:DNA-directed RNA polymerase subunit beta n=1 Tax=Neodangemannia microcystis TaxID=173495 RepID=A0A1W6EH88_9CHLO|nr:beta subunit of RNA polymerase [Neodangemannia microcystis]ARK14782.1 beta subunit of RNA polymerase [Neodangemannia microcystis]
MSLYLRKYSFLIPDFVAVQRESFENLLKSTLISSITKRNPITNSTKQIELCFYPKYYKLRPPEYTAKSAIFTRKTYSCRLYLPAQLLNKKTNVLQLQWVLLGNLPLMTKRGHFIINGSPRVIINQMVRSPGIYYHEQIHRNQKRTYYADLISYRGTWLRFEVDKKNAIWARMKKTPKIPILILLQAIGFNLPTILKSVAYPDFLLNNTPKLKIAANLVRTYQTSSVDSRLVNAASTTKTISNSGEPIVLSPGQTQDTYVSGDSFTLSPAYVSAREDNVGNRDLSNSTRWDNEIYCKSQNAALIKLYALTHPNKHIDSITSSLGKSFLYRKFMNPRTYDLAILGRLRLNKKLNISVPLETTTLTAQDLLFITNALVSLQNGVGKVDDIDNLKNRRLRTAGELITNQFNIGLLRLEKLIQSQLKIQNAKLSLSSLINTKPINGALREFFGSNPLSQFLDQTNPLAEITHKRRISSLGPGGVNRETAGMAIRGIHPTHYGRICPIETPEGQNAGLVNSLALNSSVTEYGFIKTPFFKVLSGQVQNLTTPTTFSASQEEKNLLAPGDIRVNRLNFLPNSDLPIRYLGEFTRSNRLKVDCISVSPLQMISIATSLIPFLEHDDANRALMGSNMQRQAVPLMFGERPIVGTGLEYRVSSDSGHVLQSKARGIVSFVDSDKITIVRPSNSNKILSLEKLGLTQTTGYRTAHLKAENLDCNSIPNKLIRSSSTVHTQYSPQKAKLWGACEATNAPPGIQEFEPSTPRVYPTGTALELPLQLQQKLIKLNHPESVTNKKTFIQNYLAQNNTYQENLLIKQTGLSAKISLNVASHHVAERSGDGRIPRSTSAPSYLYSSFNTPLISLKEQFNLFKSLYYNTNNVNLYESKNDASNSFSSNGLKVVNKSLEKTNTTHTINSFANNGINFSRNTKLTSLKLSSDKKLINLKFNSKFVVKQQPLSDFKVLESHIQIKTQKQQKQNEPLLNNLFTKNQSVKSSDKSIRNIPDRDTTRVYPKGIDPQSISMYTADDPLSKVADNRFTSLNYELQHLFRSNQDTSIMHRPVIREGDWVNSGDLLADNSTSVNGELALGKNLLIAYMPWEGYNFEDAILVSERLVYDDLYTSLHIERYSVEIRETKFGLEQITNNIPDETNLSHLDSNGLAKIGTWLTAGDIMVGKITPTPRKSLARYEKLLHDVVGKPKPSIRDTSLRVPRGVEGRLIHIEILDTDQLPPDSIQSGPGRVNIYIAEKRKIHIGDKLAGRHGNKGIISNILPRQDMPYLPDGTPLDMVLNPLGVPSRMNVGQIYECLLGLAGRYLGEKYKVRPFDEIYGPETSRSLVYSKLYEARLKTGQNWLFNPMCPGKTRLFDGRTGECFNQPVTVGQAYILKLIHLVDEKIHARSVGPYSLVTQQPLRGRSKHGGQRFGEMEVWALEGFGAAYTLQELITVKSDDIKGREQVMEAIQKNKAISLGTPESFKVLIRELQSLCLDVGVYSVEPSGRIKQIEIMNLP